MESKGYKMSDGKIEGSIFNIQRDSTEDGPGIRTTVFMKGCPMRCPWCHNPEGIKSFPELVWYETRCIGDEKCVKACPRGALALTEKGVVIERNLCDACGICTDVCPASALEVLGIKRSVDEIAEIVLRDKVFYDKSKGGMTLSGGEPALQPAFGAALIKAVKSEGVHVALDTCCATGWAVLKPLVELSDLVLLDIKTMNENDHLRFTGIPLRVVLSNARKIAELGKPIWVRTPVIPGYTDNPESIKGIARFIRRELPSVRRYDILAFNKICSPKYARLGLTWDMEGIDLINENVMTQLARAACDEELDFVHWSGLTA